MSDRKAWIGVIISVVLVLAYMALNWWSPFPTKKQRAAAEEFRRSNPVAARIKDWDEISDDTEIIEAVFEEYSLREMLDKIGWDYWEFLDYEGIVVEGEE